MWGCPCSWGNLRPCLPSGPQTADTPVRPAAPLPDGQQGVTCGLAGQGRVARGCPLTAAPPETPPTRGSRRPVWFLGAGTGVQTAEPGGRSPGSSPDSAWGPSPASGVSHPGPGDVWGQVVLCGGDWPVACGSFSSASGFSRRSQQQPPAVTIKHASRHRPTEKHGRGQVTKCLGLRAVRCACGPQTHRLMLRGGRHPRRRARACPEASGRVRAQLRARARPEPRAGMRQVPAPGGGFWLLPPRWPASHPAAVPHTRGPSLAAQLRAGVF